MKIRVLLLLFLATSPVVCHGEETKSVSMELLEKFSSDLNEFSSLEKFEKYGNLKLKLSHTDVFRDIYECFDDSFDDQFDCAYSVNRGDNGKISFGFSIMLNDRDGTLSFKEADLFIISKGWSRTYIPKPVCGSYPCDYSVRYKKRQRELIVGRYDCYPDTLDVQFSQNGRPKDEEIDYSLKSISYFTLIEH
ncbi:hypothetical protein [Asticcacaulis sp.]|uniref:hypothetical protein n=1 Tax=Asticcacaulis sp. TaxID=1872648 RepID=UPI0026336FE7|nr:hypothetical protein [Asticcacaulis sp.]